MQNKRQGASPSNGDDSCSSVPDEWNLPGGLPIKRRKPTYYARKEAIKDLQYQVKTLEEQLKSYKCYGTIASYHRKTAYTSAMERNHLLLAGTESLLTAHTQALGAYVAFPLMTYTHLPRDRLDRDRILRFQHEHRVDTALLFMKERTRFLDLSLAHTNSQLTQLSNGDSLSIHFDVTPFSPRFRPRDVYAAFQSFFVEMKDAGGDAQLLSSRNGVFECGQSREITRYGGLEVTWNSVSFVKLVQPSWRDGSICAVGAMDSVDHDDLFPLDHERSLMNKVTAAMLLTETLTPQGSIVSLSRWRVVTYSGFLARGQVEALETVTTRRWDAMIERIDRQLVSTE